MYAIICLFHDMYVVCMHLFLVMLSGKGGMLNVWDYHAVPLLNLLVGYAVMECGFDEYWSRCPPFFVDARREAAKHIQCGVPCPVQALNQCQQKTVELLHVSLSSSLHEFNRFCLQFLSKFVCNPSEKVVYTGIITMKQIPHLRSIFEELFAYSWLDWMMNLQEERNNVDKQLRYQCRCSFLEVILNKCNSDD